jgi:hypothetical protein
MCQHFYLTSVEIRFCCKLQQFCCSYYSSFKRILLINLLVFIIGFLFGRDKHSSVNYVISDDHFKVVNVIDISILAIASYLGLDSAILLKIPSHCGLPKKVSRFKPVITSSPSSRSRNIILRAWKKNARFSPSS